jgi:hypothetical protein
MSRIDSSLAALRLVCPEFETVDCWRLEKLAVNGTVIVDRGAPL